MLSRVANNIYWFGRYIERAENTARLIGVHANLLLDLPRRLPFGWAPLVDITGSAETFHKLYKEMDEAGVVRFLLCDERNPGSIGASLARARENLRSTRDIVPREAWEHVNELYLFVSEQGERAVPRRYRLAFLERVIRTTQLMVGLLGSTMSRGDAFNFLRLGYNLERADMTTRIIDIRSESLLPKQSEELAPFQNIQWMSVLKSLSGYQPYRQTVRQRVTGPLVLKFLLQDTRFPRAVLFCLNRIEAGLTRLPRHGACRTVNRKLQRRVEGADVQKLVVAGLSAYLDQIQIDLIELDDRIAGTYFHPAEPTAGQLQVQREERVLAPASGAMASDRTSQSNRGSL